MQLLLANFVIKVSLDLVPGWDVISIWKQMGWFARTIVITLGCMIFHVAGVVTLCTSRYRRARRATRMFLRDTFAPMREHDLERVLALAKNYSDSPIARVSACGLEAFRAAIESPWRDSARELASHAVERCRGRTRAQLAVGLNSLANVGVVAPFLGMGGTLIAILMALDALLGPPCGCCAGGISETLITTALGLFVAIPALVGFGYLRQQLERFDVETADASWELLTYLRRFPIPAVAQREGAELIAPTPGRAPEPPWEIPYDRQIPVLIPIWVFGLLFTGVLLLRSAHWLVDSIVR